MNNLQTFQVHPKIPEPLFFLEVLSRNLWWSWQRDAVDLFRRIDPRLWEKAGRNPIVFLTYITQKRLEELSKDKSFLAHQQKVKESFENRVCTPLDRSRSPYGEDGTIAYFSMEFGIHECLPLFSGGLGILAGDHLKAASNRSVPLIGLGLLYHRGYFRQLLDQDAMQQEDYPEIDIYHLPIERAKDRAGKEIQVSIYGPEGEIYASVWKVRVGRIPLYLLDTNLAKNPPEIRGITSKLYSGEPKIRLVQEFLLGIGGMRVLEALDIYPTVCHMNEGHSAFSSLERIAQTMSRYNVDLDTALEIVPRTTVFTTHTPVAAGHDEFPAELVKPYLRPLQERLHATDTEILSWGQPVGSGPNGPLSMFVLALQMAQYCNGVSRLHGKVARRMWAHVWPERQKDEIPISHITNGVHFPTWISYENAVLFERYLGPDWYLSPRESDIIDRIDEIYNEELWHAHEMSRSRLIGTCRELMLKQCRRLNASSEMIENAKSVLDQDVLTIAFARRFATYKRANLLLHDPDRLEALITSETHPVQIIFAGKAHPKDNEGKEFIKRIVEFARRPSVRHRVVFLEDYGMHIARDLVQGADVWLNTPRRPFEACGTSGMKAAVNGVLNVSILDGWWCEGYSKERGWRIGKGEEYSDYVYQDAVESQALYNVLENDVIPCFYENTKGDVPVRWVKMMKESIKMTMLRFSSCRMMDEYEKRFYIPAANRLRSLIANDAQEARNLAIQQKRFKSLWGHIWVETPVRDKDGPFRVGESFRVSAKVHLGELSPDEVEVELYYGKLKFINILLSSHKQRMTVQEKCKKGHYLYACTVTCKASGRYGFTVRVTPKGDDRIKFTPGFVTWA
jgi:starch phosphorylase